MADPDIAADAEATPEGEILGFALCEGFHVVIIVKWAGEDGEPAIQIHLTPDEVDLLIGKLREKRDQLAGVSRPRLN
jgi:hypothetical protein